MVKNFRNKLSKVKGNKQPSKVRKMITSGPIILLIIKHNVVKPESEEERRILASFIGHDYYY